MTVDSYTNLDILRTFVHESMFTVMTVDSYTNLDILRHLFMRAC